MNGEFAKERRVMTDSQIRARGVCDPLVLAAINKVPRHLFVPEGMRGFAHADEPLPIGQGQTISQPYIVAYMTEALGLQGGERVLEVGTGSGYQTAVLAEIAREVWPVEIVESLALHARTLPPPGRGWPSRDWGLLAAAAVTMTASKGAASGQPPDPSPTR